MSKTVSKVLVAGEASSSLSEVICLISNYKEYETAGSSSTSNDSQLPIIPVTMAGLEVDTKYFKASLIFKSLELLDSLEAVNASPVFANQANGAIEGSILVCSSADQAKTCETCVRFGHIRDAITKEEQEDSERLRVVLYMKGCKMDNDIDMDTSRQQYFMWAIDNAYEFIEIDTSEDLSKGWDEREKEGLPRLIEALHSQRWNAMILKGKGNNSNENDSVNKGRNNINDIKTNVANDKNDDNSNEDSGKIGSSTIDMLDIEKTLLATEDNKDMQVFEGMSRLVQEAKAMHEKAQNGDISDAERREKASGMALKFMEM